jgi:hypothetical protein
LSSDFPEIDLHRVLMEIEDEVRAKRASGELSPEFERELDLAFARIAPAGAVEGDFDQLLARAEQQAFVDLVAPNDSARPGVPHVKRVVQKTVRWYLRYVVEQITGFSHTLTRAVRQLGDRVEVLERQSVPLEELEAATQRATTQISTTWQTHIVAAFTGTSGRVLHARCGRGDVVAELRSHDIDAYGVDPSSELVALGTGDANGLDLRPDDELSHLRSLLPGALDGLLLSGCVDTLPRGAQIELVDLAATTLGRGGRLVLVVSTPQGWERTHSKIEVDLAGGRPMHAETWKLLLEERGFSHIDVHDGPRLGGLDRVPGGSETAAGMNANIDRLNDLLFSPTSALLVCRR